MADPEMDEDLFADLYDGEADEPAPASKPAPVESEPEPLATKEEPDIEEPPAEAPSMPNVNPEPEQDNDGNASMQGYQQELNDEYDRPMNLKEDGKMFIGGLNWETTDQSLKEYFSQFGDVVDCQVMRDGATGRSRGFGFLTFKDPKTVNTVMVKEHFLDGKLIDPKRAIPREEQERTAKIFVGGVSQECTDVQFKAFFETYGRVLDATLMMDKDTGRPRGFGFVTFDSEAAVDRTLEQPLSIHGKMIEVKRAEPRGNLRDGDGGHNKFGRQGRQPAPFNNNEAPQNQGANQQNANANMSPAMMAQYWQRMQQYFSMMQQQMMANGGGAGGMNPMAAMQNNPAMMQQMMARQNMTPQMMQQMQQQMGGGNGMQGFNGMGMQGQSSPVNGGQGQQPGGFSTQEQMMFEQQKYERQQNARMQQGNFQGGNTWEGMYDDVPAPDGMQQGGGPGMRGNFGGRGGGSGGRGGRGGFQSPAPAGQAPANAPTGPKNAGQPGANYRGGGRGGRRGFHPYARGNM